MALSPFPKVNLSDYSSACSGPYLAFFFCASVTKLGRFCVVHLAKIPLCSCEKWSRTRLLSKISIHTQTHAKAVHLSQLTIICASNLFAAKIYYYSLRLLLKQHKRLSQTLNCHDNELLKQWKKTTALWAVVGNWYYWIKSGLYLFIQRLRSVSLEHIA